MEKFTNEELRSDINDVWHTLHLSHKDRSAQFLKDSVGIAEIVFERYADVGIVYQTMPQIKAVWWVLDAGNKELALQLIGCIIDQLEEWLVSDNLAGNPL